MAFGTIFCDVTSRSCIQYQTMVRSVLFSVTLPHGLVFSIKPWYVRYYFLWRYLTVLYSVSNHGALGTIFCGVTSRSCIQYQTMVRSVLFSVTLTHGLVFSIKPWCVRYYFLWRYLTVLYSVSNHGEFGTIFCDVTSRSCIQYQTMVSSVLFSVTLPHGLVFSIKPWWVRYYFLWRYLTVLYSVSNHGTFGIIFTCLVFCGAWESTTFLVSVLNELPPVGHWNECYHNITLCQHRIFHCLLILHSCIQFCLVQYFLLQTVLYNCH